MSRPASSALMAPAQAVSRLPLVLLVIIVLACYRAAVIWGYDLPLFYDQAYYYYWSLHPDWGYYSKPPMVAWLIWATTSLFGASELAIASGAIIVYSATAVIVYQLGKAVYGEAVGTWSAIAFASMPLVGFNSLFVSTDAPLMFFWALALLCFRHALQRGHIGWWLATGVVAGLGLLSKYTMAVLAIGLLAYLLADRDKRRWLADWRLWIAVAVAALVFTPNLLWNAGHHFISFQHTAEISQLDRDLIHPDKAAEFLLGQFIVFGPVFMFALVKRLGARKHYAHDADRFMLLPAIAMLSIITVQALLSRAHANWAAPAYVTATIFVVAALIEGDRKRLLTWGIATNLLLLSFLYHYHSLADAVGVQLSKKQTPYARIVGWRELGQEISVFTRRYPHAALMANSRKILAYLSYYTEPKRMDVVWFGKPDRNVDNHYELVADISQTAADEFLYVGKSPLPEAALAMFRSHAYLGERTVTPLRDLTLRVYIYHLSGFTGYR